LGYPFWRDKRSDFNRLKASICKPVDKLLFRFKVDNFFLVLKTVSGSDLNNFDGLAKGFVASLKLGLNKCLLWGLIE
jgi:hypothetical protein